MSDARKNAARSQYDAETRMYLNMERAKMRDRIGTAISLEELAAISFEIVEHDKFTLPGEEKLLNKELAEFGQAKKATLHKYAGGGKSGGSSYPTTAKEWADREETRLAGMELVKTRKAEKTELPEMPSLADLLAEEDEDEAYRIEGLIPVGGRIILSAPMKSGKTTLVGNLVRSLADGDDFLGKFAVTPISNDAVVTILDTEMSKRQMKSWLRDQGIKNPQRIHAVSLRGRTGSFEIMDDTIRAQWAALLREMNTEILILDPLGPVFDAFGMDENSSAVGTLLSAIDALAQEAGVQEVFIMHHTGHEGERARGHSKLRGWPDAEWFLRRPKDENDPSRFFKAFGRDVDAPEGLLEFDMNTRHLTMAEDVDGQPLNRVTIQTNSKSRELRISIIQAVNNEPGITAGKLWETLGIAKPERGATRARDAAVAAGQVRVESHDGKVLHYPNLSVGQCSVDDLS